MDNLTHTLAGGLLAEGLLCLYAKRSGKNPDVPFSRAVWLTSVLASNFSDIDVFYAGITEPPFGYLLHHRGHTHTIAAMLPSVGVILGFLWGTLALARLSFSKVQWKWLFVLALLGVVFHILLDAGNSYGVHPFWPFFNGWFYGDTLFIIEPLLWIGFSVPLAFCVQTKVAKALLFCVPLLAIGLGIYTGALTPPIQAKLVIFTLLLVGACFSVTSSRRVLISFLAVTGWGLLFFMTRSFINSRYEALIKAEPGRVLLDSVLTPYPANPLCWFLLSVETDSSGQTYRVRKGLVTPFEEMFPLSACPISWREAETTAKLAPLVSAPTRFVHWQGEYGVSVSEFNKLISDNCRVSPFLRFSRVPYVEDVGTGKVLGDLRFDRQKGLGFAETWLHSEKADAPCPRFIPPWVFPRKDVFSLGLG